MKSPLPRIQSAVPRTLQAQLEIAKAIRTLLGPDQDELLRRRHAEIASLRRDLDALARDIPKAFAAAAAAAKAEFFAELKKYSPDQPRVPKGNPDGGEWTKEGDGRPSPGPFDGNSGGPKPAVRYASLTTSLDGAQTQTDAPPPGFDVAAAFEERKRKLREQEDKKKRAKEEEEKNKKAIEDEEKNKNKTEGQGARSGSSGYPIGILEEDRVHGSHIFERHVNKSEDYLLRRARTTGNPAESFTSVEAANKLINATIAKNPDEVRAVVNGELNRPRLTWDFKSSTGYEAFADTPGSEARIRPTRDVFVVIERDADPSNPRGFRLITASPFNDR